MEYRYLGRSGLRVSALSLGTMTFGGRGKFALTGEVGVDEARVMVEACLDAGVNLIDTADVYSEGASEEIVGQILDGLSPARRDGLLIASKARFTMGPGPNDAGLSRHHLVRACEASLRRLRTDHIDLYQVHEWDGRTPVEETLSALDDLVRAGKVRYVGCSNFSAWHVMKSLAVSAREHLVPYVSQQIHYSLQTRDVERELLPMAVDQGLGVLVWSPLAGGLLSGKYRRGVQPEGGRHLTDWNEPPVPDTEQLYDIVDALAETGAARGVSAAQVALAWVLTRPAISSVIMGVRTPEQLADNLAAASLELSAEELDRLERVSRPHLAYPYWHQLASASERLSEADLALIGQYMT
ncbi:MAG: aldo/keto reductase [Kineosporiaceae bacterium]|nr:aldo/keto reductase [Kineosporiaceae bacterium]